MTHSKLLKLVSGLLDEHAEQAMDDIVIAPDMVDSGPATVSRGEFAMAMSVILHHQLLDRVPTGHAYVEDCRNHGRRVLLDHGALRTVALPGGRATGELPGGIAAFARILEPLGYVRADVYPLERLKMTGYAFCHRDYPESVAQFFVSELHVDRFSPQFQAAAERVFATTRDPLDEAAKKALAAFAAEGQVPFDLAVAAMPGIVAAFGRHHGTPTQVDYETLQAESAEAAWIATEGNAFNHATDRVEDVEALVERQRALGRAMKEKVEVSASGRVRQTAYRADWVDRDFVGGDGAGLRMMVPGSFYEFISREVNPETGRLDLKFDSANAQGIFKMTAALDA